MEDDTRERLVALRHARKLSQTSAGQACDPPISQQTISEMESGAARPLYDTVERYCRQALGARLAIGRPGPRD